MAKNGYERMKERYAALVVEHEKTAKQLQAQIEWTGKMQKQIEDLAKERRGLEESVEAQARKIETLTAQHKDYAKSLEDKNKAIAEKDKTISAQTKEITDVKMQLYKEEGKTVTQRVRYEKQIAALMEHMGRFKRWTWELKQATTENENVQ